MIFSGIELAQSEIASRKQPGFYQRHHHTLAQKKRTVLWHSQPTFDQRNYLLQEKLVHS